MNVVDTSGWLEYFADGPNADDFSVPLKDRWFNRPRLNRNIWYNSVSQHEFKL